MKIIGKNSVQGKYKEEKGLKKLIDKEVKEDGIDQKEETGMGGIMKIASRNHLHNMLD